LVLLGKIYASAPTLELALQKLNQKRQAVSRLLEQLETKDLQFGEPRFPEQAEPDPMRMAQMRRRLPDPPQGNSRKRSVLASYSAQWPIADKSSDDMLIFVDRIQFEVADLQRVEEAPKERPLSRENDPMREIQSVMADMAPPEGDEIHFLFLSSLTEAQREEVLAEAFRDGHAKAALTARAAGKELDDLCNAHWFPSASEALQGAQEMYHFYLPLLAETPFRTGTNQAIHLSPRAAKFVMTIHLTFGLK